jgi:prepilin-type N-terminal cleavage/methylation domain-containing protein/prepilin-type processing-associated H-X9-DG protein
VETKKGICGFTLIELLVVIAVIALLMGILAPALTRARRQGKRAVCLSNIRQFQTAWLAYAGAYDGRIVNGGQAWNNTPHPAPESYWCGKDWYDAADLLTQEQKIERVKKGALFAYIKDVMLYRCPESRRDMHRTYSIVNAMNGSWDIAPAGSQGKIVKFEGEIKRQAERVVFMEEGYPSPDAFIVAYDREQWLDKPQAPHIKGSNWGFVDGHAEFWRWEDARTMRWADIDWSVFVAQNTWVEQIKNKDLRKIQRAAWGKLGYTSVQ